MADAKVSRVPIETLNKRNCFQIVTPPRTYYLHSDNAAEVSEWITAISHVIDGDTHLLMPQPGPSKSTSGGATSGGSGRKAEVDKDPVEHLMFVLEGVAFDPDSLTKLNKTVAETSPQFSDVMKTYFPAMNGAVDFALIEWQEAVPALTDATRVAPKLQPSSGPPNKAIMSDLLLDLATLTSPKHRQNIINTITALLNEKYVAYVRSHPNFSKRVSIAAHGLASVVLFDILAHQDGHLDEYGLVTYPPLQFSLENFFALSSPLSVFLQLNPTKALDEFDGSLPKCKYFYNIFHPADPLAHRFEPLIAARAKASGHTSPYPGLSPVALPRAKAAAAAALSGSPSTKLDSPLAGTSSSSSSTGGSGRSKSRSKSGLGRKFRATWGTLKKTGGSLRKKKPPVAAPPAPSDSSSSYMKDLGSSFQAVAPAQDPAAGKAPAKPHPPSSTTPRFDYQLAASSKASSIILNTPSQARALYWESQDLVLFMLTMLFGGHSMLKDYTGAA